MSNFGDVFGNERGSVLIVGLLILVVLTLLGITGTQSTSMEERMSRNMRLRDMAFQVAEAGLRSGENFLQNSPTLPAFNGTNGLYATPLATDTPHWKDFDQNGWSAGNSRSGDTMDFPTSGHAYTAVARYYIESFGSVKEAGSSAEAGKPVPTSGVYRVTSHAKVGGAEVVLQSTFLR